MQKINHLQYISDKIIEKAPEITKVIAKKQSERYPALLKLGKEQLDVEMEQAVIMFGELLEMEEAERKEKLQLWGEENGTSHANKYDLRIEGLLSLGSVYRNALAPVIKNEALKLNLNAIEMYDLLEVLENMLDEATYFYSMPFVKSEKEKQRLSQKTITELSVPIVSLNDDTAILPIVGTLNHDRARMLENRVLSTAAELQLRNLIIDLSGLQTTDTHVAQQLFNLFDALSLLGIKPIVSGISPSIAITLTDLGLTFGRIKSFATLKQALEEAEYK